LPLRRAIRLLNVAFVAGSVGLWPEVALGTQGESQRQSYTLAELRFTPFEVPTRVLGSILNQPRPNVGVGVFHRTGHVEFGARASYSWPYRNLERMTRVGVEAGGARGPWTLFGGMSIDSQSGVWRVGPVLGLRGRYSVYGRLFASVDGRVAPVLRVRKICGPNADDACLQEIVNPGGTGLTVSIGLVLGQRCRGSTECGA